MEKSFKIDCSIKRNRSWRMTASRDKSFGWMQVTEYKNFQSPLNQLEKQWPVYLGLQNHMMKKATKTVG